MNTVLRFPATTTMTVEQALASAEAANLRDVLICGYDEDGDFIVRSSRMDRKDALWLAEMMKRHALDVDN